MDKGDSFALINRKKVIKTMTYNTSEFKITLKNFEVEELFNHFDMFDLQEWEFDLLDPVHVQQKDDRENVTLAKEI